MAAAAQAIWVSAGAPAKIIAKAASALLAPHERACQELMGLCITRAGTEEASLSHHLPTSTLYQVRKFMF